MPRMGLGTGLGAGAELRKPWHPADFGGKTLWLRGDLGTSTTTNGAACTSWTDQAQGLVFSQATGSKKPAYVASAINGRPGLGSTFAAVTEMTNAIAFGDLIGGGINWSAWIVAVFDSIATDVAGDAGAYNDVGIISDGGIVGYMGVMLRNTNREAITYFYPSADAWAPMPAFGTPVLIRAGHSYDGAIARSLMRVNNGVEDSRVAGAGPGNGGVTPTHLFSASPGGSITGRICEILLATSPRAADLAGADRYFNDRYALWTA